MTAKPWCDERGTRFKYARLNASLMSTLMTFINYQVLVSLMNSQGIQLREALDEEHQP